MLQFKPMDPAFPIQQQIGVDAEPVVLVNVFTLAPEEATAGIHLDPAPSRARR